MTNTQQQAGDEAIRSEIFAYSGIECRLTVSHEPTGYAATAYCPFCGKAVSSGPVDLNQESAASQAKAKFQDHIGHCPMRNAKRPPLGMNAGQVPH